jgi:hypothetical protein
MPSAGPLTGVVGQGQVSEGRQGTWEIPCLRLVVAEPGAHSESKAPGAWEVRARHRSEDAGELTL